MCAHAPIACTLLVESSAHTETSIKSRHSLPNANVPAVDSGEQARLRALQTDIAAVRCRIVKAEKHRDTWKMAVSNEKYLEGYLLVEMLECQLDEMLRKLRPSPPSTRDVCRRRRDSNQAAADHCDGNRPNKPRRFTSRTRL